MTIYSIAGKSQAWAPYVISLLHFSSICSCIYKNLATVGKRWWQDNTKSPSRPSNAQRREDGESIPRIRTSEGWRCRQLHYLIIKGIIYIHPTAASPSQGAKERDKITPVGKGKWMCLEEMNNLEGWRKWQRSHFLPPPHQTSTPCFLPILRRHAHPNLTRLILGKTPHLEIAANKGWEGI